MNSRRIPVTRLPDGRVVVRFDADRDLSAVHGRGVRAVVLRDADGDVVQASIPGWLRPGPVRHVREIELTETSPRACEDVSVAFDTRGASREVETPAMEPEWLTED